MPQGHAELPITGYLDRHSRRPGESLAVHVSVPSGEDYRARLVRVISGDPNPAGPGLRFEDLSARFDQRFPGRRQAIRQGSFATIPAGPRRQPGATTWTALVWLAALPPGEAAVISEEDPAAPVSLCITPTGLAARLGPHALATEGSLGLRRWHRLWLSADPATGAVTLGSLPIEGGQGHAAHASFPGLALPAGGAPVLLAARGLAAPAAHLTGKLEDPAILRGYRDAWMLPDLPLSNDDPSLLAGWDLSKGIATQSIADIGPQGCQGSLTNIPTRAMTGARWTGTEMCWRHRPQDYACIYFHADDLGDCGWAADFDFAIPPDLPSGAYALHLTCAAGQDWIPFYVVPPRGTARPAVAFLASTFTYQAYANHSRGNCDDAMRARIAAWGAYPHNPDDWPLYGRSTYNRHPDNSGIAFSSRRRPILTMRPGFLTFTDARGSGLRHYPADTHLLAWLEARGIAFDVITDEDLHDEGAAILAPYKCVLTGSHPEYHTTETWDGLYHYTRHGGRLCYLGGNGFYWRVAMPSDLPGMMELRRAEGGIRAWAAEPGEYHHQTDGQYGGLWRRNGRPPQKLACVGFSGQGLFEGTHYRRQPASYAPDHAWIFAGIEQDTIGDYGLSGGGAAGFELDRADPVLGTPDGTVILAVSEDPPKSFVAVPEELLSHVNTVTGEPAEALKRGEIVHADLPGGGAIFAVGSITFCGSLWQDGAFQGPVSRLLENVVRGFSR
jgi:N,N-dimethylformamidase